MNEEIRAFKCGCGRLIEICGSSDQYLTIFGNVLAGECGGLIGGRLPEYSKEIKPQRMCRACFLKAIDLRPANRSLTGPLLPGANSGSEGIPGQQGAVGQQGLDGFAGAPGD